MTDAELEEKAIRIQAVVEEDVLQARGLVPMLVRASDYRMPFAEDYEGAYQHCHLLGKTEEEIGIAPMHVWRAWENTPTDTAWYLGAMSYRYRCSGYPDVLEICRRTLGARELAAEPDVFGGSDGRALRPAQCLVSAFQRAMRSWSIARKGGMLVATGETATRDSLAREKLPVRVKAFPPKVPLQEVRPLDIRWKPTVEFMPSVGEDLYLVVVPSYFREPGAFQIEAMLADGKQCREVRELVSDQPVAEMRKDGQTVEIDVSLTTEDFLKVYAFFLM